MAILEAILAVFTAIGAWIGDAVNDLMPMFYTAGENGGLTFLGVLATAGLAFSVIFLIVGLIQNFLHFRS